MPRRKLLKMFSLPLILTMLMVACTGASNNTETIEPAEDSAENVSTEPEVEEPTDEGEETMADAGTVYKIGFVAAITGPGAGLGVPERNTAEMVADQLAEGGITGPDGVHHEVEMIILDSESNPDTAASVTSRLIEEEEVDILVAGTLSGNSLAMVPLATEAEVPLISMASALSIVQDPETGEARHWTFKTPQENLHSAVWQAQYLSNQGITSVCYLFENSGYGQDTLAQGTAAFEEVGIEIAYSDTFERSDTEFPQILSVQSAGCEAVVVGSIPPGASLVQAAVKDAMPDMLVIQGHGVCNQQFIELAPQAVEGTPLPCGRLLVAEGLPEDDPQKELLLTYIEDYTEFTGGEPISTFGGHAYDALLWAAEALESLDEGLTLAERRAAIRDYIEANIKDWPGTGGVFNITADDHLGLDYTGLTFVLVEDGGYVYYPEEEWSE
jgi:branched-chain amino acid transport system substrate-binding protein